MANELKNITDHLKTLIKNNFERFKKVGRVRIDSEIKDTDLGFEDFILINSTGTGEPQLLCSGKLETYFIDLVYIRNIQVNEDETKIKDFYESIDDVLIENLQTDYWYYLNYEMNPEIDEYLEETDRKGFVLTLIIKVAKF